MSFSLKQAAPAEDTTAPAPPATNPKKKRPELRGGLDR